MRQLHIGVFLVALLSGCAATGSSTVIGPGSSGEAVVTPVESPTDDSGAPTPQGEGPVDYASFFGPPSSADATPNSLNGLWAGLDAYSQDMRIKFGPSSIILAVKCSETVVVGIKITARVTATSIKILESKSETATSAASSTCRLAVTPDERPSCSDTGSSSDCFELEGTKLDLRGFLATRYTGTASFTKLSD